MSKFEDPGKPTAVIVVALFAVLMVGLVVAGCSGMQPDLVGPGMVKCLDRHDEYVAADESLSPVRKKAFLQTSWMVRDVLERAGYPAKQGMEVRP